MKRVKAFARVLKANAGKDPDRIGILLDVYLKTETTAAMHAKIRQACIAYLSDEFTFQGEPKQ